MRAGILKGVPGELQQDIHVWTSELIPARVSEWISEKKSDFLKKSLQKLLP